MTPQLVKAGVLSVWAARATTTREVRCRVETVSSVIDAWEPPCIDLLKIDVEGSEEAVLLGIRDECAPTCIRCLVAVG